NSELRCGRRAMETPGLLEWISPWFYTTEAEEENPISAICSDDFHNIPRLKFVNWEFSGGFNYPHQKQEDKLCWLYTMCDQLEAMYNIPNPDAKPIRISKQYILDHYPIPGAVLGYAAKAYHWAVAHTLVLDEDYDHPFTAVRQLQRDVKDGRRLKIGDLMEHLGHEQKLIEYAISMYPIAASMFLRKREMSKLEKKPTRPYVLSDDPDTEKYRKHAIVLSGAVSYRDNKEKLDSYLVKDPQYITSSGRFFLKKFFALLDYEYNALNVVAPFSSDDDGDDETP
ncbi:hypothetical protein KSS87_003719, partial [Heliosperma pusillum]